jgi:FlaA1/EpsC-like NDP-sugar epimerase
MKQTGYEIYSTLNQRLIDALIAGAGFWLAYQIRFEWSIQDVDAYQMWLLLPAVMLGRLVLSSILGTYRLLWRYIGLKDALTVARGYIVFSTILLALRLGLPSAWAVLRVPLSVIVLEFFLSLTGSLSARVLRRLLREDLSVKASKGAARIPVVLIGAGRAGVIVTNQICSRPEIKLIGFLDDDPKKIGAVISGLRVLGPVNSLPSVVKEHGVEEVIICIPRPPRAALKRLWALCEQLPVRVKIVPTLEEILNGKLNIAAFRDVQMADLLGREAVEAPASTAEVDAAYRGRRILITGAGGSIGSELAHQLLRWDPRELTLLDKDENGLNDVYCQLAGIPEGPELHPVVADIRYRERLRAIFSRLQPEVVFHAAAHKHVPLMEMNPCEAILNNVVGTRHLVEESLARGVSSFIFISTDKAVKPLSIMGASKRVCEMIVQAQRNNGRTRFSCVRFGNVMGSRGSVIPLFQKQIAGGGPVTLTHQEVNRFMMTIPEAVRLLIQAGAMGSSGEIFVLDMGDPVPILGLAQDLIELSGLRPGKDVQIEMTHLRPGEKITEELFDPETETATPTRFEKIWVARPKALWLEGFADKLAAVESAAASDAPQEVYRLLRELAAGWSFNGILHPGLEEARPEKLQA